MSSGRGRVVTFIRDAHKRLGTRPASETNLAENGPSPSTEAERLRNKRARLRKSLQRKQLDKQIDSCDWLSAVRRPALRADCMVSLFFTNAQRPPRPPVSLRSFTKVNVRGSCYAPAFSSIAFFSASCVGPTTQPANPPRMDENAWSSHTVSLRFCTRTVTSFLGVRFFIRTLGHSPGRSVRPLPRSLSISRTDRGSVAHAPPFVAIRSRYFVAFPGVG